MLIGGADGRGVVVRGALLPVEKGSSCRLSAADTRVGGAVCDAPLVCVGGARKAGTEAPALVSEPENESLSLSD